jgi:hypothetical protein
VEGRRRDLTEPEIERLYRQRWELSVAYASAEDLIAEFHLPPGVTAENAAMLTHCYGEPRDADRIAPQDGSRLIGTSL